MKILYLFRSNLKNLEYYHSYNTIEDFEKYCHDFYLLMPLEFLKMGVFDKVYIWRLSDKKRPDIEFKVKNEKGSKGLFIQKFSLNKFKDVFKYDKPDVSIFRGGFKEYDNLINMNKSFFGKSFYLGASRRFHPSYGGIYDYILYESENDLYDNKKENYKYKRFFKTVNPKVFYPIKKNEILFDVVWPWKYTSDFRKGEKFLLESISKHDGLKQLRFFHCGNEPKKAERLFNKYGVKNIQCEGNYHYLKMVNILNNGFCGLVTSDKEDGCPRLSTEIISCGTPLVIRDKTRILEYYKGDGFLQYYDAESLYNQIIYSIKHYNEIRKKIINRLHNDLSLRKICEMNLKEWEIKGGFDNHQTRP